MHAGICCAGRKTGELGGLGGSSELGILEMGDDGQKMAEAEIRDLAVVDPHFPIAVILTIRPVHSLGLCL